MADGFLSRWSKRKLEAKDDSVPPAPEAAVSSESLPEPAPGIPAPAAAASVQDVAPPAPPPPPPPTMEDVLRLTAESDFARFARPDVEPQVRNAAMKKLFSDPRYNVQDGLDTYIGDYNTPDPLPESMLRQLASAQFLRLFEAPPPEGMNVPRGTPIPVASEQTVAQSAVGHEEVRVPTPDADPDLRLQQDDAPPGEDPGEGAG